MIKTMVVLGISANSRLLALAIIKNNDLADFHIHLFKERWSGRKVNRIIQHIKKSVQQYSVTNIALTIPYEHYQNKETKKVITKIQAYCEAEGRTITSFSPSEFQCLFEEARAKKKALMASLVEKYPELTFPYRKELRNKRRYYHKLFEAVAAGTLLARDLTLAKNHM